MNEPSTVPWQMRWRQELASAEAARLAGNEGKARVCARRAAGVLGREYLRCLGLELRDPSAYAVLRRLQTLPDVPEEARAILIDLLVRVNEDHSLPVEADLIAEARRLGALLGLVGAE